MEKTWMNALLNEKLTSEGAKRVRHEIIAMQQGYRLDASAYDRVAENAGSCYQYAVDEAHLRDWLAGWQNHERKWAKAYSEGSCMREQCLGRATIYGMLLRQLDEVTAA